MKVSIIVPVYNVEMYIEECILSLCNQTLKEMEIIIVNDGTKDNSMEVIKKFDDNRIKIISQENSGLSAARNAGIKIATGEYIAFVDSDDFILFDSAYEEMYNIALNEGSDLVSGNALWYYSNKKNHPMHRDMNLFPKNPITGEEFFLNCMKSKRVYAPVWINLYRRKLIVDNNILFKEGIFHEDEEFTPRILLNAKTVSIYNKEFYAYRQRENSIMNSGLNPKRGQDIIYICLSLQELFKSIKNKELEVLFKEYLTTLVINQIIEYKIYNIDKDIKVFIKINAVTYGQKFRAFLINYNMKLFIIFEKIFNKIKIK